MVIGRSTPDARDIVAELTVNDVRLQPDGSVHDPTDPLGPAAGQTSGRCTFSSASQRAGSLYPVAVANGRPFSTWDPIDF